jgi:hypothetical protein
MATTEFVVEEVAENLEEAASAVRRINAGAIGYVLGGICIGVGVGFVIGRRFQREQITAKIYAESEAEVDKIREYYAREEKRPLEEIIVEKGYDKAKTEPEPERPLPPPVPVSPARETDFIHRTEVAEKDKYDGWNYPYELSQRNWKAPHIIHQDEFFSNEETPFGQTTYVYYAGDDKLTDTDNTVLNNRESFVGPDALINFGHGTDDANIVYVRNPALELEIEIVRHNGTYEEEVLGLEREEDEEDEDGTEATDD